MVGEGKGGGKNWGNVRESVQRRAVDVGKGAGDCSSHMHLHADDMRGRNTRAHARESE